MAGYLLNLTFDLKDLNSSDGLFNHNSDDAHSKKWFTVPTNWPGVGVSPGGPVGVSVGSSWPWNSPPNPVDSNGLACAIGDQIYIRFKYRNWNSNYTPVDLGFVASFGRTASNKRAKIASPFVVASNGANSGPQTVFQGQGSVIDRAWIFYVGQVAQNLAGGGAGAPGTYPYSFIVSAATTDSENYRQWGHDPTLVVGGSGGPLP